MLEGAELVAFVATTDLQRSHAFYGDRLRLRHVETTPFANVYDAGGTKLRVTLVEQRAGSPYTVLGWQVPDIVVAVRFLAERGIAVKHFEGMGQNEAGIWTAPGGARIAWFEDPDGNVLSVGQASPPPAPGEVEL